MEHSYQFELVRSVEGLRALQPEWDRLYAAAHPHNIFLSYGWTAACWNHNCSGSRPFVLAARMGGRLVGIAPLREDRSFGFRVLRFIGDGRSDYLGLLTASDQPGAQDALLTELSNRRGEWDLAVLRQLAEPYSSLPNLVPPKGLAAQGVEGTVAPHLAYEGDWDALLKAGPGWLKRMQKASRKWEKEGGTVERHTGAEAADYVDEVAAVEARSWKGREGVARFQPGRGQEFLRETLQALAPRGEMELWLARKDGRAVAFEINFLGRDRIWLYQGAYDEEYRKFSPGGLLDCLSIERAWREGAREYDFMSGDEPYKAERTIATRPIRYTALFPKSARGCLAYSLLVAPRWRLKGSPQARAALQLWIQLRNNPGSLLRARG